MIITQINMIFLHVHPQLSQFLRDIEISHKGNKKVHFNTLKDNFTLLSDVKDKWCDSFNEEIFTSTIQISFKNAKQIFPISMPILQSVQTINNKFLKRMNMVDSENCLFCDEGPENTFIYNAAIP